MICRLHGIAHELHLPGRPVFRGPGCEAFHPARRRAATTSGLTGPLSNLDMAILENELKQAAGITTKLKMTVADMIVTFEDLLL